MPFYPQWVKNHCAYPVEEDTYPSRQTWLEQYKQKYDTVIQDKIV
ncbi:MAG TPA: hypothetical protein VGO47_05875 [Chlamydiales bacterium]|nr:hypothetical protein [Chlamydiales bacterium]